MLAVAIAVPAMAAPSVTRPEPQVIRFELPETIPYQEPEEELPRPSLDISQPSGPGPAALPFAMSGTYTTRARAQQCLAQAIYYEAASETLAGQRAVAQVVMNRVRNPAWPGSVCGVVFQGAERSTGCQFSFTCDGSMARRPQPAAWAQASRVARAALGGYVHGAVGLATHYHTLAVDPVWASALQPVTTIGAHRFYRRGGTAGQASAFVARYDGFEPAPAIRRTVSAAGYREVPAVQSRTSMSVEVPQQDRPETAQAGTPMVQHANLPPQSGSVLPEHQDSGRWLVEP